MNLKPNQKGFTIVELLIVIVVIAILAAISIVAFTGIQQRGRDSAKASDASNIVKALTAYTADGHNWPTSAANAVTALNGYPTANLSSTITGKIGSGVATSSSTGSNVYRYQPCPNSTAPTGAQISYYRENLPSGETNNIVALKVGTGTCPAADS